MSGPFAEYAEARLRVPSVHSRTPATHRRLRLAILDAMVEAEGPVFPADVAGAAGVSPDEAARMIGELADLHIVVLGTEGEVRFAYPVSGLPTSHRVTLADGRSFSAMCAIDAMGCAFTFGQDVDVESRCHGCGEPIRLEMRDGRLAGVEPSGVYVLHVDLSVPENWAGSC